MTWTRGRRAIAAAAGFLMAATTSALVPVSAQESPPVPEPYLELLNGLTNSTKYVRLVDGDAATPDPQQGFVSSSPWVLGTGPELLTIGATADPATVLGGTPCLVGGAPIGPLPSVVADNMTSRQLGWVPPLPWGGVTGYRCNGSAPAQIVAEDTKAQINRGEHLVFATGADVPLNLRRAVLSINAGNAAAVRATARLDGVVVGTVDVDVDQDCVNSTAFNPGNIQGKCLTRVDPFFGALRQRYMSFDFGTPFDSIDVTATADYAHIGGTNPSRFYLDGEVFGGTIGGDTGNDSVSEPPTDDLPGYEVSCTDADNPPPDGPCGGKDVSLAIARFRADVNHDGDDEQVLDIIPSGPGETLIRLTMQVDWAPENAPVGSIPLSGFDEDGPGPDGLDPAPWCSVDPPGAPGKQWCLDTTSSTGAGPGQIQVSDLFQGTGDPRVVR